MLLTIFVLFIFFIAALAAYFFLGGKTGQNTVPVAQLQNRPADTVQKKQKVPKAEVEVDSKARHVATQLRDRWLQLQTEAEVGSIGDWGGQTFVGIREKAVEAAQLMAEQRYEKAGAGYREAISALESLQASRPTLLAQALAAGEKSLLEGDSAGALTALNKALALDSVNATARHGLARARTLDQVLLLYKKALAVEKRNDFESAQKILIQINTLDSEFQPAVQALSRIEAVIRDKKFNTAMAVFLQALAEGKEKTARNGLIRAEKLRPQSPLVREGEKQLQQLVTRQALARLQRRYEQAAAVEKWQQAMDICGQALKVDPQAAFARTGLNRASRRLALDKELQDIIDHPLRLQEEVVRAQARQILAAARSVVEAGPRLAQQIDAADTLLAGTNRQVEVVLQSDNATEIVIYRVGRLGRFSRRTLRLRPGHYTIIGTRAGFRDVRKEFQVRAGAEHSLLSIRCTEVI